MQFDIWTQSLLTAMNTLWGKLAGFIPNLLGALVVVLLGFVIAKLLDALLSKLLAKLGLDRLMGGTGLTKLLARVGIQVPVLEVKTDLLNYIIAIVLITVGLAAALALGLGSREVAGQIIAGIYVRELYQVGQQVKVGDVEGTIEEIGTVKTILLTEEGELVSLANRLLLDQRVTSR